MIALAEVCTLSESLSKYPNRGCLVELSPIADANLFSALSSGKLYSDSVFLPVVYPMFVFPAELCAC